MSRFGFTYTEAHDEPQQFSTIEYPQVKDISVSLEFDEGTCWDNIILEFAKFLDMTGYVGAYEKVTGYIDQKWAYVQKVADEDISNPGLSD